MEVNASEKTEKVIWVKLEVNANKKEEIFREQKETSSEKKGNASVNKNSFYLDNPPTEASVTRKLHTTSTIYN